MKRFFLLGLLLVCLVPWAQPKEEPASDFDKFLEELFGPPPKKAAEEKAPTQMAPAPAQKPTTAKQEITAAKLEKAKQDMIHTLNEISELLGSLIPAIKHEIFSPKIHAIHDEIHKKVINIQTKSTGIVEAKLLEDKPLEKAIHKKIPYQEQGTYGLEALIKEILSEDVYTQALGQKTNLHKKITSFAQRLSSLNMIINTFFTDLKAIKLTEQEELTQLKIPLAQRKEPMSLLRIEKKKLFHKELKRQFQNQKRIQGLLKKLYNEKNRLEKDLNNLFLRQIPHFTQQLETLINDPEVKKEIEEAIQTRKKLEEAATRESKDWGYRGRYDDDDYRPRRRSWGGGAPGTGWGRPYGRKGDGPEPQYQETREEEKQQEPEKETIKTKDDKVKDNGLFSAKDKKEEKPKDEKPKTDLISLMHKATALIKEICSAIKPGTTIIDEIVGTTLEANHYKIQELNDVVTQIETTKTTKQAQDDQKKRKTEWQSVERGYRQAFDNHLKPIILLAKYGYAKPVEKPDGRYEITMPTETQKALQNTYNHLKRTADKKTKDKESAIKQEITDLIKAALATSLNGIELFDINHNLIALGTSQAIEPVKKHLLTILQMILAAKNNPLAIATTTANLNIQQTQLNLIKRFESLAQGKFSSKVQKNIFNVQKHKTATEKHFVTLTNKIEEIMKAQNITGPTPQTILKSFTHGQRQPLARGENELNELFNKRVSIAGKEYTYQQVAQYHFAAAALNELDQCIELIKQIRAQTRGNWNLKRPARPDIQILEAVWTENFMNAQGANVITIQLQNSIPTRVKATIEIAQQLFLNYYTTQLNARHKLFIRCKIKTDDGIKEKEFIFPTER